MRERSWRARSRLASRRRSRPPPSPCGAPESSQGRCPHWRAAAIAEGGAPERALELVDSPERGDYRYLHSTRAELLRRLGRTEQARAAFEYALRLAATDPERRFLARRLAEL